MADFTALKATIQQYIKQNGNEEITGAILQDVLLSMVNTMGDGAINTLTQNLSDEITARGGADSILQGNIDSLGLSLTALATFVSSGYIFRGIANQSTVPSTLNGKVFYLTSTSGQYSNMGNITVQAGISALLYDGAAWSAVLLIAMDNAPTEDSGNMVKSGGVHSAIASEAARALAAETNSVEFNSTTKNLIFKNSAGTVLYQMDASVFVIDGMVQNVEIKDVTISGQTVTCLVISFNTDAGKQDINIPLTQIFNPANYYDKTAIDTLLLPVTTRLNAGYLYMGLATVAGTPDTSKGKVFYLTATAGTYTNYGNTVVADGLTILSYDGTSWTGTLLKGLDSTPTQNSTNLITSGGVYNEDFKGIAQSAMNSADIHGFIQLKDSADIPYFMTDGRWMFNTNRQKTPPIRVNQGDTFKVTLGAAGTGVYTICCLDENLDIVVSASTNETRNNADFTVPSGVSYVSFSNSTAIQASPSVVKVGCLNSQITVINNKLTEDESSLRKIGFTSNKELNSLIQEMYLDLTNESFVLSDVKSISIYKNQGDDHKYGIVLHGTSSILTYLYFSYSSEQSTPPEFVSDNYGRMVAKLNWGIITDASKNYVATINSNATVLDNCPLIKENYFSNKANISTLVLGKAYEDGKDFDFSTDANRLFHTTAPNKQYNTNRAKTELIAVSENDIIDYAVSNSASVFQISALNKNRELVVAASVPGTGDLVSGRYIVPEGVSYLIFCSNSAAISTSYARLYANKKKVNKVLPVKIVGFDGFSGSAWIISSDKKTATINSSGYDKKLLYKKPTYEDKFILSAGIVATGSSFEACIGKYDAWAGTLFSLAYDGSNSYLKTYKKDSSSANPQLTNTIPLDNVTLESGKKIYIRIEKRTDTKFFFDVVVSDEYGNMDSFENIGDYTHYTFTNSGWGKICAYLNSGDSMVISDLSFGYPILDDLRLICLGHSFIEGNSINSMSAMKQRWDYRLCEDLGLDNTLIAGHGGENTDGLLEYIDMYAEWFRNAKYAIIAVGENDLFKPNGQSQVVTQLELDACITNSELIAKKLLAFNITPIWLITGGKVASYQNGVDYLQGYNDWMRSQPYYIDVSKCVRDASGQNNDATKFLEDETHWTVATHGLVYNVVKAQAGYLLK